jgi:hypothetical protein
MDDTSLRSDCYVYLFRNPLDNNNIFYIGEGTGDRAEQLNNRNPKTRAVIEDIRKNWDKPVEDIIEILRDNLDKNTALRIEGAAIDLIGIPPLTNMKGGVGTTKWRSQKKRLLNGLRTNIIGEIIDPKNQANIAEPAILIRINKLYRPGMDADSLFDSTRGIWVIGGRNEGGRRDCPKYAFAVFEGVVIEVYKIKKWYLAGTQRTSERTPYKTRPDCNEEFVCEPPRWEFEGEVAESEIREKYLNKSVKHYLTTNSQNPITYVKCPPQ